MNSFFKKISFYVRLKKTVILSIFISVTVLLLSSVILFHLLKMNVGGLEEGTLVEYILIMTTIVSVILVIVQLRSSVSATCCNMLSDLNLSFVENERVLLLHQKLEESYRVPEREIKIEEGNDKESIHTTDVMAYFSFFEVLYEYVKHKVITIEQMDDLFGYRFFLLVHNRYIQERELYAVPSSYANIFELYDLWQKYREFHATDKCSRFVVMPENQIPQYYLKEKTYLQERIYMEARDETIKCKTKIFQLKTLFPHQLDEILKLQDTVIADLKEKHIFEPSSEEEVLESMLVDGCFGMYFDKQLVAVCIMVFNRKTKRNLAVDWEEEKSKEVYEKCLTVDSIQVHPEYRGYGIQKEFLQLAEAVAKKLGVEYIAATVAPDNSYSLSNFRGDGYVCHGTKSPYIKYGSNRLLMRKIVGSQSES